MTVRAFTCARCDHRAHAGFIRSRFTGRMYCADLAACTNRSNNHAARPQSLGGAARTGRKEDDTK